MYAPKKILVVARWPLGGIRTYMRYMFKYFPRELEITLLVTSTHENDALTIDAKEYGGQLRIVNAKNNFIFSLEIMKELKKNIYDLILCQGFMSSVATYFPNLLFKIPHILTIHGVVEDKYLTGFLSTVKRFVLKNILANVTVLYGVSHDILQHLYEEFPTLQRNGPKAIVIPNGILPEEFDFPPLVSRNLRKEISVDQEVFLFGFMGRFMPQKGFDLVIDAVDQMREFTRLKRIAVVAVGTGDYIREYQQTIQNRHLQSYFHFLPFQPMVHQLYTQVNAVIFPSRWEASPLLPIEVLCVGTPLIASDCIGLRETVADTPTLTFSSGNLPQFIEKMVESMNPKYQSIFREFVPTARHRYDASRSSKKLIELIYETVQLN